MDRPLEEPQLVARAKRGDLDAYTRLVEMHQTIAFRTAFLVTGSAAEAEEATQDALVKAHRALARFREGAPFRPWLFHIAVNEARNRRVSNARREWRALLVAFAVLLLTCGTVVAAVPAARDAVLEFLHLRGATVERRERLPADARPGPLDLGPRTTLAAARRRLAFAPLVPKGLGHPDGVHVSSEPFGGELTLDYRRHAQVIITEFRGDLHPAYAGKIAGQATSVEPVGVDGRSALWVAGAPHFFFYRDGEGRLREHTLRLAPNVLLVEHDRVLVRIEGRLGKPEALRIARSLG